MKQINHEIFEDLLCLSKKQVIDYVENKASNIERHTVEKHLLNCKLCSAAIEGFSNNVDGLSLLKKDTSTVKSITNKKSFWLIGIAASFLIIFLVVNEFPSSSRTKGLAELTQKETAPISSKNLPVKTTKKTTNNKKLTSTRRDGEHNEKDRPIDSNKKNEPQTNEVSESKIITSASTNNHQFSREKKEIVEDDNNTLFDTEVNYNDISLAENTIDEQKEAPALKKPENERLSSQPTTRKAEVFIKGDSFPDEGLEQEQIVNTGDLSVTADTNEIYQLGLGQYEQNSYKQAIITLSKINDHDSNYYKSALIIARSHLALNQKEQAIPYLKTAINGDKETRSEAKKILDLITK